MKRMVFCFIYSSMLGKSFPYGESIFIHSYLLFSVVFFFFFFIKEPEDDDDDDDDVEQSFY